MNKQEYLFTQLSSECSEVAHRITKILQFGLHEIQPGQDQNNEQRFWAEMNDLLGSLKLLIDEGIISNLLSEESGEKKIERIKHYMNYAIEQGTLK